MKKYLKKILPFVCVLSVLTCSFVFSVGASSSVTTSNYSTLKFTEINRIVKYSNSIPGGKSYYNQSIPMEACLSWNDSSYNNFLDMCDSNYFYIRMYPTTSDFKITVPAGGTYEGGLSFHMYALTGDTSTGNPPTQFSGTIPVSPSYTSAGKAYSRVRLVNESGSVEYFIDYDAMTNPNTGYITWSDCSWKNISGEDLFVDYFEFGCTKTYGDPIFLYFGRCVDLNYRVFSPGETSTNDISNSIKTSAEETQKIVVEGFKSSIDQIKSSTKEITGSVEKAINDIENSIEESTDKITNGWTPKPEKPPGSDKIDDYVEQDEELKNEIQGGIDKGNEIIDSLSSNLLEYGAGFAFIILLFDRLNFSWLNTLMNISLTLGVSAFLLNIAPSLTRGIGRLSSKGGKGKKGG